MNDINKTSDIETNIDTKNMKSVLETRRPININMVKNKNIVNTINNTSNIESPKYIPKYGWIPDTPDNRDYQYSDLRKKMEEIAEKEKEMVSPIRKRTITVDGVQIPTPPLPLVDLRSADSPIFSQGDLNSCTSNALVGALQFLEKKDKVPYIELSRLFVYYDQRVVENTINIDIGAKLRDGIKTLVRLGVCSDACWPYNIQNFSVQPGHRCYREAANHMILTYYRINTLDDVMHCFNNGYPLVFGFSVYSSFESEEVVKTGIVNMPSANESLLGGHAVMAIGYDMNKKIFPESIGSVLCRNSLGTGWGQSGYFWLPFEYLTNRNLSDDLWTIRRGKNL